MSDDAVLSGLLEGSYGRKKRSLVPKIAGPVVIICAILAVLVAVDYWINAGEVYGGVEVGTVALGGKTPSEAQKVIAERTTGALEEFDFTGPEGQSTFNAREMGVDFDVEATVEEAYSVGRRGNVLDRLSERAKAAYGTVTIPPKVDYAPEIAQEKVRDLSAKLNREPRKASVVVVGSQAQVDSSSEGYRLDFPATMQNVDRAVEDMTGEVKIVGETLKPEITTQEAEAAAEKARSAMGGQLVFNAGDKQWTLSPADVGSALDVKPTNGDIQVGLNRDLMRDRLSNVYTDLTVEPLEAGYEVSGANIAVTESRMGKRVEDGGLLDAVEGGLFEGQKEYQVPVVTDRPGLTTARAEALKPTEMIGSYRTNYSIVPDDGQRKENLEISSNAVSGTLVAPGEVFSMNGKVAGLDYNSTKVIIDGKEAKADGGGLCQVTSTLYNAVNYAGLDVIERYPHAAQLPYIRPGMDATVWFGDAYGNGALDMKFKNTSDGYVLLNEYVSPDGYIYAEVYGQPTGLDVKTWSEPVYRNRESAGWITYQTVKKDGKVLYDGVLHEDSYQALTDEKGKLIPANKVQIASVNP
ncbi:MAG: peptidoglycan binding domain-containing protein [Rubrobacteraceae bacterium]